MALAPNDTWATNEATLFFLGRGALAEAEHHARNGVRIAPRSAQSHYALAMVLTEANRPSFGAYHYRRALELAEGRDPTLLANYALCLKNQGQVGSARALYAESLAAAPAAVHTLLGAARLEEADREPHAALALLDQAEAVAPGDPRVALVRATVLGRLRQVPAALALLDGIAGAGAALGPSELLEKGRLLDKIGHHQEAFAAFDEGKRRLREATGHAYAADHAAHSAHRLSSFFTARRLATLPCAGTRNDVPQPIFILGFPRSGTTLLEQTLSAHPAIAAGDELPLIAEIAGLLPRLLDSPLTYPEALAELWMGDHYADLDSLRDHYLRKVAQLGILDGGASMFTDKMPLNETHLGLIALLFPRAPMIHVVRHPLDVMVSVFSNLLTHGHYCAYALESAATHYALILNLVEHYRREMTLRFLRVRYEDLVRGQESTVRAVLDFLGVPFDQRCLAFHENRRYARTASYAQVSERLYDRSVGRYKHYLEELRPVISTLAPGMKTLGYGV